MAVSADSAEGAALPALDAEGFLLDHRQWSPAVAERLARREGIVLGRAHWEVLDLLRAYYNAYDSSPAMRALVKYCRLHLGDEKGRSIYLLKLFPGSPAKIGSKLAGLPKPANCL
jgi:tRNA 2-thiouridine synthesizing protein E